MKKILGIITFALLLCFLSACKESNTNTISPADLTEREEALLSITSESTSVLDYNLESDYKEVSVWLEKYEKGKLVGDKISHLTTGIGKSGSIILMTPQSDEDNQEITFNIGISGGSGISSFTDVDKKPKDIDKMMSVWGQIEEKKTINDKEIVLAHLCYSSNEFGMSSLNNEFYDNPKAHMNDLKEYDVAYILKAQFNK